MSLRGRHRLAGGTSVPNIAGFDSNHFRPDLNSSTTQANLCALVLLVTAIALILLVDHIARKREHWLI